VAITIKITDQKVEDGGLVVGYEAIRDGALLFKHRLNYGKNDERAIRKAIKAQVESYLAAEYDAPPDLSGLVGKEIPFADLPLPPTQEEISAEAVRQKKAQDIANSLPAWATVKAAIEGADTFSKVGAIMLKMARPLYWLARNQEA
jgi:hypothetical protein